MNVALPALIVFFLLLPGFIFRTNLKRAERTSLDFSPVGQVVAEAILWALVLHSLWLCVSHFFFKHDFQPAVLMKLLSSAPAIQAEATEAVGLQFNWIAAYFATLISVAFALPKFIRYVISRYRLDRADAPLSPIFRFHQAPWYYLLTGADLSPRKHLTSSLYQRSSRWAKTPFFTSACSMSFTLTRKDSSTESFSKASRADQLAQTRLA